LSHDVSRSAIVIYFIVNPDDWGPVATNRVRELLAANEPLSVSDLVRMECLVRPLRAGDFPSVNAFQQFFGLSGQTVASITSAICDRAALYRARYRFQPLDALHLAAAIESGCTSFLTSDQRLARFPDLPIEVLSLPIQP
jgi:predicted nucleic acid-binding protein